MILFFYLTEDVKYTHFSQDYAYHRQLFALQNEGDLSQIYFTTPADFRHQLEAMEKEQAGRSKVVYAAEPALVLKDRQVPRLLNFVPVEDMRAMLSEYQQPRIAIINAMSVGLGDHIVGSVAFRRWIEAIGCQPQIDLFQINPHRVYSITQQYQQYWNEIHCLPNTLEKFLGYDFYFDLGSMLAHDEFNELPMIDFYLKIFGLDPSSLEPSQKRMQYKLQESPSIRKAMGVLRSVKRPLLLFNHKTTTGLRDIPPGLAKEIIRQIILHTNYLVLSTSPLEYQAPRFLDLSRLSYDLNQFSNIVANVDAIVTADTFVYHLADAFSKPTVVIFTTIDPGLRTNYYPQTTSFFLGKGSSIEGLHKFSPDRTQQEKEENALDQLWDKLSIPALISCLP